MEAENKPITPTIAQRCLSVVSQSLATTAFVVGSINLLAAIVSLFSRLHWFAELFSNFLFQYLIALTISGLTLLWLKRHKRSAIAFFAMSVWCAWQVLPVYVPRRTVESRSVNPLRIVVSNVLSENCEIEGAWTVWLKENPDVLVLLEFDSRWQRDSTGYSNQFKHRFEYPSNDNFGIACYSNLPVKSIEEFAFGKLAISAVAMEIQVSATNVNVVAAHPVPPVRKDYAQERNRYLEELAALASDRDYVVVLGDLNLTPYSPYFKKLLSETELADSRRGFGIQSTWPVHLWPLRIPIDHCLVNPEIRVVDRRVLQSVGSDHFPVLLDIEIPESSSD